VGRRDGITQQKAMNRYVKSLGFPIAAALFLAGSAFLLKLAYLSVFVAAALGGLLLLAFYAYVRWWHGIRIPALLLILVLAAVEVDALGNYFRTYGRQFESMQYDEFSHMLCSALVTPTVFWLLRAGMEHFRYRLPPGLITTFVITLLFSISGFYEIIELWDERYFGDRRIWNPHDAPNDLQWNLTGIVSGAVLTYAVLKANASARLALAGGSKPLCRL
jgi:O-antigen/teichoic acid export membrane protein